MNERRNNAEIIKAVEDTIKTVVNGKIDGLRADVETHSKTLREYIDSSTDWRCRIEQSLNELKPVNNGIKWFNDTKAGASYIAGLLTPIMIIIGVIAAIIHFIRGI